MDKVLIADDDGDFLVGVKKDLDKLQQFEVLTASDGKEAISILENNKISILATDIQTPDHDILELLSYMSRKHPKTPCIIMSNWGKPWYRKVHEQQTFLYHLEKPFKLGTLASAIFVGLNMRDEGMNFRGMTMTSLLPLLDLEQKTCRLQIMAEEGKGFLYFDKGVLIDAHYEDLSGEAAARKIAAWNRISFLVSDLPRHRTRKRVKTKIMEIADASWEKKDSFSFSDDVLEDPETGSIINLVDEISPQEIEDENRDPEFRNQLRKIRNMEGYLACALVDDREGVVKTDQNLHTMDLQSVAKRMQRIFAESQKETSQVLIDPTDVVTLHTRNCIFQMQLLNKNQLLIGVFDTNCNLNDLKQGFEEISRLSVRKSSPG